MNTTKYGTEKQEGVADLSSLVLSYRPEWLAKESFTNEGTMKLIREAYAVDYEYFGY
jgi:hypothetical protein